MNDLLCIALLWTRLSDSFSVPTNIRYPNIVQLIIFDTDLTNTNMRLWNKSIMARLYCEVSLDV